MLTVAAGVRGRGELLPAGGGVHHDLGLVRGVAGGGAVAGVLVGVDADAQLQDERDVKLEHLAEVGLEPQAICSVISAEIKLWRWRGGEGACG